MEEVLSRSINPRIIDVEVTEEFLRYRYPLEYLFGYPSGSTTREMRIVFMDVERVEIFHNHFVFIWASDKSIMAKILFANDQDAKLFTDLLLSFRARRVRGVRGSG